MCLTRSAGPGGGDAEDPSNFDGLVRCDNYYFDSTKRMWYRGRLARSYNYFARTSRPGRRGGNALLPWPAVLSCLLSSPGVRGPAAVPTRIAGVTVLSKRKLVSTIMSTTTTTRYNNNIGTVAPRMIRRRGDASVNRRRLPPSIIPPTTTTAPVRFYYYRYRFFH